MSNPSAQTGLNLPIKVMVVDLDPIFRRGLKTCLEESADFEVVAELGRASEIMQRLESLAESLPNRSDRTCPVDLLIWSVDVRHAGAPITLGLPQLVRSRYPSLPLCVLLGQNDSWLIRELWQGSVAGCWLKDASQIALLAAMRQIVSGQQVWDARVLNQLSRRESARRTQLYSPSRLGLAVNRVRQNLGDRSLRELEQGIAELDQMLAGAGLGIWERLVLEGRFREMQAARKLVQFVVLPTAFNFTDQTPTPYDIPWPTQREAERQMPVSEAVSMETQLPLPSEAALVTTGTAVPSMGGMDAIVTENQFQTYKGVLLETVIAKLSQGLQNLTAEPLEIDILNATKRQALFFIILRLIEETVDDLRFSQVMPAQLSQQRSQILRELWQRATADFLGKYVMIPVAGQTEVQLVPTLLAETEAVETEILDKIPLVEDLFAHLIFQSPLQVNNQAVRMGAPEAMRQAEALLENFMIRLANAVVAPLLNQFGTVELVKQTFYDRRWMSTREIERFRNALSWKYRMHQFFGEPKNIFESQVPVLVLTEVGIRCQEVYTPRDDELKQLSGIPLFVTLALEARDAIAPPLRTSFTWVGRGVVYLLTQVVGRGIGLVGRGILQGIGTAWQETRSSQHASKSDSRDV